MSELFSPIETLSSMSPSKAGRNVRECQGYLRNNFRTASEILSRYNPLDILKLSLWDERRAVRYGAKDEVKLLSASLMPVMLQSVMESDGFCHGGDGSEIKEKDWERLKAVVEDTVRRIARLIDSTTALVAAGKNPDAGDLSLIRENLRARLLPSSVTKEEADSASLLLRSVLSGDEDAIGKSGAPLSTIHVNIHAMARHGVEGIASFVRDVSLYEEEYKLAEAQMRASGELDGLSPNDIYRLVTRKNGWQGRAEGLAAIRDGFSLFMPSFVSDLTPDFYRPYTAGSSSLDLMEYISRGVWPAVHKPFVEYRGQLYSFVMAHVPSFMLFSLSPDLAASSLRDVESLFRDSERKADVTVLPSVFYCDALSPSVFTELGKRHEADGKEGTSGPLLIVDPDSVSSIAGEDGRITVSSSFLHGATMDTTRKKKLFEALFGEDIPSPSPAVLHESLPVEERRECANGVNTHAFDDEYEETAEEGVTSIDIDNPEYAAANGVNTHAFDDEYEEAAEEGVTSSDIEGPEYAAANGVNTHAFDDEMVEKDDDEIGREADEKYSNLSFVEYEAPERNREELESLQERYSIPEEMLEKEDEISEYEWDMSRELEDDIFDDSEENALLDEIGPHESVDSEFFDAADTDEYESAEEEAVEDDGQLDFMDELLLDPVERTMNDILDRDDEETGAEETCPEPHGYEATPVEDGKSGVEDMSPSSMEEIVLPQDAARMPDDETPSEGEENADAPDELYPEAPIDEEDVSSHRDESVFPDEEVISEEEVDIGDDDEDEEGAVVEAVSSEESSPKEEELTPAEEEAYEASADVSEEDEDDAFEVEEEALDDDPTEDVEPDAEEESPDNSAEPGETAVCEEPVEEVLTEEEEAAADESLCTDEDEMTPLDEATVEEEPGEDEEASSLRATPDEDVHAEESPATIDDFPLDALPGDESSPEEESPLIEEDSSEDEVSFSDSFVSDAPCCPEASEDATVSDESSAEDGIPEETEREEAAAAPLEVEEGEKAAEDEGEAFTEEEDGSLTIEASTVEEAVTMEDGEEALSSIDPSEKPQAEEIPDTTEALQAEKEKAEPAFIQEGTKKRGSSRKAAKYNTGMFPGFEEEIRNSNSPFNGPVTSVIREDDNTFMLQDEHVPVPGEREEVRKPLDFIDSMFAALGDVEDGEEETVPPLPMAEEEKEEAAAPTEEEKEVKEFVLDDGESLPEVLFEEEFDEIEIKTEGIVREIYKKLGKDSFFASYLRYSDKETLRDLGEVIRSCWDRQQSEGKDKLFNIPDSCLSILLARDSIRDELRLSELVNNAGGVMYARGKKEWNAVVLYIDDRFVVEEAMEKSLSREAFSSSDWKRVTYIGEQMRKR